METRLFANWVIGDIQGRLVGRAGPGRLREEPQPPADTLRPLLRSRLLSALFSLCIPFIYLFLHFYLFIMVGVHEPQCAGGSPRTVCGHWFSPSTTEVVGNELGSSGLAAGATEQSPQVSLLYCPVFFSRACSLVFPPCFIFLSRIYPALWTTLNRFSSSCFHER